MEAPNTSYRIAFEQGFTDGDFFPIEQALEKITYTQDRELLAGAYEKYKAALAE
jgi:hypothetical protein